MISERNDPGNTGAIRLVRLHSRNSFSTFENWQSKICNPLASGGVGWQRSTFGVPLSSESDRLKAKIDRCCPNTGSTQRSSTIRRKTQSRLRPNSQTNAHRLTRAAFAARWSRLRRRPPALRTPCVRLDTAMHITQHSKKKSKRVVFGISRVLISCNP